MICRLLRATSIWFLIVGTAVLNGLLRETVLVSILGEMALPVSGVSLAILVFLVTLVSVPFIGPAKTKTYLWIGIYWLALTLSFEFLFGHFVAGKAWREVLQVFNVQQGNLFSFVLLVTTFSPWIAAGARGLLIMKKKNSTTTSCTLVG